MNILGIDFGQKRIGLAWMQEGLDVVLPFGVIEKKQDTKDNVSFRGTENQIEQLVELIKTERIDKVVMGLPLGLDGEETPNTKRVRTFAEELQKNIDIFVDFVDERFTTHEAKNMGGEASLDEKAAMLILQEYVAAHT